MSDLGSALHRFLAAHPARRYWIGYSGGLDSHVLLHLSATLGAEGGLAVAALHINHRLHPDADAWQHHCETVCARLGVPFQAVAVDARPDPGESPEEAARRARYRAFTEMLGPDEALMLGQHQDDQAETVLLQLLRGAGPAGLAGMPACAPLGRGTLLRPFLDTPRQALRAYAEAQGLNWIDDPGNADLRYDRNFLRHRVVPLLRQRWPACSRTLARSARHCGEAARLLEEDAAAWLVDHTGEDGSLDLAALAAQTPPRQRWLLRTWLRQRGARLPSRAYLDRILRECLQAGADRLPCIRWDGGEVRRWRGRLYCLSRPLPAPASGWQSRWDGTAPLPLPDGAVLEAVPAASGIVLDRGHPVTVRYRRGGETLRHHGHRRPLKKFLQERGVPPWRRPHLPLVYRGGELIAVADLWHAEHAGGGTAAVRLRWRPQALQS